jgi:adenylate cyclase, class 2
MHDQEVEIKLAVDDLAAVEQKLKSVGATLKAERVLERNVRYENAEKTLTEQHKVVRMRQDTRARLTWKEPNAGTQDESANVRTELEVTVSDYDVMDVILQKLGYAPHWRYEKYRTTYTLNDCEVTLDELPFGSFVEIEGERDQLATIQQMLNLADHKNIPQSYSELMRLLKEKIDLSFDDLTFENFRGVSVPAAWWK